MFIMFLICVENHLKFVAPYPPPVETNLVFFFLFLILLVYFLIVLVRNVGWFWYSHCIFAVDSFLGFYSCEAFSCFVGFSVWLIKKVTERTNNNNEIIIHTSHTHAEQGGGKRNKHRKKTHTHKTFVKKTN